MTASNEEDGDSNVCKEIVCTNGKKVVDDSTHDKCS